MLASIKPKHKYQYTQDDAQNQVEPLGWRGEQQSGFEKPSYTVQHSIFLERRTGFEPVYSAWKAEVLPLDERRVSPFPHPNPKILVDRKGFVELAARMGLEPTTSRVTGERASHLHQRATHNTVYHTQHPLPILRYQATTSATQR